MLMRFVALVVITYLGSAEVSASIMLPGEIGMEVTGTDSVSVSPENQSSCNGATHQLPRGDDRELEELGSLLTVFNPSSTSSSSSTTSSDWQSSGAMVSSRTIGACTSNDVSPISRLFIDQAICLRTPPVSELLRPPRC